MSTETAKEEEKMAQDDAPPTPCVAGLGAMRALEKNLTEQGAFAMLNLIKFLQTAAAEVNKVFAFAISDEFNTVTANCMTTDWLEKDYAPQLEKFAESMNCALFGLAQITPLAAKACWAHLHGWTHLEYNYLLEILKEASRRAEEIIPTGSKEEKKKEEKKPE